VHSSSIRGGFRPLGDTPNPHRSRVSFLINPANGETAMRVVKTSGGKIGLWESETRETR